MATTVREYTTLDRSRWGRGMWDGEPDKIQWVDDATGLDCLMHRGPLGAWCGYVGVAEGHPLFGIGYSECAHDPKCEEAWCDHRPESAIKAHGGLTYSAFCRESEDESVGICHVPFEGRPHLVWWLGFDCAHSGDLCPAYRQMFWSDGLYRDRAYVEGEVRRLAAQLAEIGRRADNVNQ